MTTTTPGKFRSFRASWLAPLIAGAGLAACSADQSAPVDQSSAALAADAGSGAPGPTGKPPRRPLAHMLERFDANGNGTLEVSELPPGLRERIAEADTNGDGALSEDELRGHLEAKGRARFAEQDTNGDGALDATEAGRRWQHIKQADSDGNASVTFDELRAAMESGKLGPHGGGWGKGKWHRDHDGQGCGGERGAKLFERFDTDGDGLVKLADLPEHKRTRLAEADRDGDGAISKDELDAHRSARLTARFREKDTDGDGFVTEAEAGERWQHLRKADGNADGKVDAAELTAARDSGALCEHDDGDHRGRKGHGGKGHGDWSGKHRGRKGHDGKGHGDASPPPAGR